MTTVDFYFDPSCPWCWVTSRWLIEVSGHRDMKITWKPFSLALKNGELDGNDTTGHRDTHTIAHGVLRVIEAIVASEDIDRGQLYTEFGKSYFVDKKLDDDVFMAAVIERLGLDKEYLKAAKDPSYDAQLQTFMNEAIDIVGNDVGVPLIIFTNDDGEKQGYFGPVLQGLPDLEESLKLWDGLSALASSKHFFELKRGRTGGAQVASTTRVFPELN